MRLNALGTHLLLELRDCEPSRLNDVKYVRATLLAAAEDLGVTVLSEHFHQFSPQGVTGIVAIAESHFSIHTWPEYGYGAVDIFTCGTRWPPNRAARYMIERFGSRNPLITEMKRGLEAPIFVGTPSGVAVSR